MKSVLIKDDVARVFDDSGHAIAVKEIKFVNLQVAVPAWRKMGYPIFIAVCAGLALYISPSEDNKPPSQAEMDCQARVALHNGPCHFSFSPGGASVLTWKVEKAEPPKPTPAQVKLQAKAEARKVVNEVRREVAATHGAEPSAEEYAKFLAQMAAPPPEESEDLAVLMGVVE